MENLNNFISIPFRQSCIFCHISMLSRGSLISFIKLKKCSSFWGTLSPRPPARASPPAPHWRLPSPRLVLQTLSFCPLCQMLHMPLSVYSILGVNLMFSYPLKGASKCFEFFSKSLKNRWRLYRVLSQTHPSPRPPDMAPPYKILNTPLSVSSLSLQAAMYKKVR